jgi:hypothetical protein
MLLSTENLPPINPTPCLYLRVMSICTLGHMGGVTGVGYPVEGEHDTRWLTGVWPTQAKVEGIVLKAAWHWGSDSSVINDPLGEPDHTQLYAGLLSTCGSTDGDHVFPPIL